MMIIIMTLIVMIYDDDYGDNVNVQDDGEDDNGIDYDDNEDHDHY